MEQTKCLIIGSGPAGYTAAIYTGRANIPTILYEGLQPGGQLTITTDIENFPGYPNGISGSEMMDDLRLQAERFGASLRSGIITKADLSQRPFKVTVDDGTEIEAETVIIATGGAGRLHYQGFPTSNHYGATADGLVLGYRAGAKLLYADTLQYHPTGAAFPEQIYGALVTEKVRSLGAKLVNKNGEVFMHPLETRDVSAASIIRECSTRGNGVKTPEGYAVWLDTPMIELKHGAGTIDEIVDVKIDGVVRSYYVFSLPMGGLSMKIPVDHSDEIGIRRLITPEEADSLMLELGRLEIEITANWNKRYRENMLRIKTDFMK